MKYCADCGTQNLDEAKFCASCGAAQPEPQKAEPVSTQPQQQPYTQQQLNYVPQPSAPKPPLSTNPALNVVKTAATSPVFMTAIILYSTALLFNLINVMAPNQSIYQLQQLMYQYDLDDFLPINGFIGAMQGMISGMSFIALIPTVLICIGLWMFWASSRNPHDPSVKTAGVTIIKGVSIYQLVCLLVIPVILLLVLIVGIAGISGYSSEGAAILTVAFIIICAVLVLPVLYSFKIIGTINGIKRVIATGTPNDKVSGFVIVMNYIMAGLTLITSFSSGAFGVLIALLSGSVLVLVSVAMSAYKKEMQRLMFSSNTPANQTPQYSEPRL